MGFKHRNILMYERSIIRFFFKAISTTEEESHKVCHTNIIIRDSK